ncbi:MAG: 2Fe-2S iron-sulfur cluster binding domain-containing protein, partial [Chloroflexi bacterium]|nr:2Fe-2S iron-sulfur cluster binding domain-containing protein [Chloroflexota bacterium]
MPVQVTINRKNVTLNVEPGQPLLETLRQAGYWSVKHGCETGECGACSVLLDGKLVPTCIMVAGQVEGHSIETVEGLTQGHEVHPIQQAFVDTGAVQCGYCTPAMILATKSLLD